MNESEIVKTVRQLGADIAKHGRSDLSKRGVLKLLSHDGTKRGGGVLVQWWDREKDERKKIALSAIVKIVGRIHSEKVVDMHGAGETLAGWCDELDVIKPPKGRQQSEHTVTKWVRKNWHKYGYNKTKAVRAYIELYGGDFDELYKSDLANDLKKEALPKPKNK